MARKSNNYKSKKGHRSYRSRRSRRSGRSSKSKKNRPVRYKTAYIFFLQSCWRDKKQNRPNEWVNFGDFNRQCAAKWRQMSAQEKRPYQELQAEGKAKYDNEMARYRQSESERKAKMPKRPLSVYIWFCKYERPKVRQDMPHASLVTITRELGRRWRTCTENEKTKYYSLSEKDRERYQREKESYYYSRSKSKRSSQTEYDSG